jgi:hypothetical protein
MALEKGRRHEARRLTGNISWQIEHFNTDMA